MEALAAVMLLRTQAPDLRIRFVNVVDLMTLQPSSEHPHGLSDEEYDAVFPPKVPTIFAFHGYPWGIHRLTYRRHNHDNLHVRGYKEEGTTTTPFDMCVLNNIDRFQLALDAITRVKRLAVEGGRCAAVVLRGRSSGIGCTFPKTAKICRRFRTGNGSRGSLARTGCTNGVLKGLGFSRAA